MPLAAGTGINSIIAIDVAAHGDTVVLNNSGTVTKYDLTHYDTSGSTISILPEVITQNAAYIEYTTDNLLLVTLKDGTVWVTGEYNDRYKLTDQIHEIGSGVTRTANAKGKNSFAYQLSDGSWKQYENGVITNIESPSLSGINFTVSSTKSYVGDSIKATITESYSNGSKKTIPLSQANATIEKPYLLKKNSDGTLKALAVGVTKVTVTSGSLTKTLTIAISLPSNLSNAIQRNSITYLPVQSVFKALGGTVVYTSSSKTFDIQVGTTTIRLKQGDSNAKVNGNNLTMNAAVRSENNTTVFPAALLSKVFGAALKWDSKYKIIHISFGNATLSVETPDTAKIYKKELQGNLASYIGKSYWVNHFQGWERFNKVTITDIIPDSQGYYFTIVFKKQNGTQLKSYEMARDNVVNLFTGSYYFLNYDPYKKYKWSTSTWTLIKEEKVATGMTKDQVLLSIGQPASTSRLSGNGITVETWGYGYFNYVTFVNGIVTSIYTS
nr:stalk domain-containing protein [Paenibacillus sp. BK720]